jgi:hypothetical protein
MMPLPLSACQYVETTVEVIKTAKCRSGYRDCRGRHSTEVTVVETVVEVEAALLPHPILSDLRAPGAGSLRNKVDVAESFTR